MDRRRSTRQEANRQNRTGRIQNDATDRVMAGDLDDLRALGLTGVAECSSASFETPEVSEKRLDMRDLEQLGHAVVNAGENHLLSRLVA